MTTAKPGLEIEAASPTCIAEEAPHTAAPPSLHEDGEETPLVSAATSAARALRYSRSRSLSSKLVRHFSHADSDDEKEHEATLRSLFGFDPTVSISSLLGLVSGTLYGFGRYSRDLKDTLLLSQSQVQALGILMDTGNYVGHPLTGYAYDLYGPRISCLLAALIVFGSYLIIHIVVNDDIDSNTSINTMQWSLLGLGFTFVGFGSGLGYVAALGSTTKKFQGTERSGRAVGLVAAGYGLSSTLVGITYNLFGLQSFFLFWAALVGIINCCGAYLFPPAKRTQPNKIEGNDEREVGTESSEWKTWRQPNYWILFYSFACVTGCGLFVINNISTMVESLGGEDSLAGFLIFLLSICNCLGRLLVGIVADKGKMSKLSLLRLASLLMASALLISAVARPNTSRLMLSITTALVAIAYGSSWVLIVAILSEMFGRTHFGTDYGLIALGPSVSGLIFNSISAWIYEKHIDAEDGSTVCLGSHCYSASFTLTALAAVSGLLLLSFIGKDRSTTL